MTTRSEAAQAKELRGALLRLGSELQKSLKLRPISQALPDQPFDSLLLRWSELYARSRALYLETGGTFTSTLVSSPRTLSSAILLEKRIEFTPLQKEYLWAAMDPGQRHPRGDRHLLTLRGYIASVFHEQSHRILWELLPPLKTRPDSIRRYLNFAECLVIATDIALADQLGPRAYDLYLTGVIYNPGEKNSELQKLRKDRRGYRNYLQACAYATYLFLEFYTPLQVEKALNANSIAAPEAVLERTGKLSRDFIAKTNPLWQRRHFKEVARRLGAAKGQEALDLPEDPLDQRLQYLWAEKWFERIGL